MPAYLKRDFCKSCPINHLTGDGYVPLHDAGGDVLYASSHNGPEEITSGKPFSGGAGRWLDSLFRAAKLSRRGASMVNVIGCNPGKEFPGSKNWTLTDRRTAHEAVQHCIEHHFKPAVMSRKWSKIVALGAEALTALTGRVGINTWRGSPLQLKWLEPQASPCVMPSLHPANLMRSAKMFPVVRGDLLKTLALPREEFVLEPGRRDLEQFYGSKTITVDLEWNPTTLDITLFGVTNRPSYAVVCEWREPFISQLRKILERAEHIIGHNLVGAEWWHTFRRFGWKLNGRLECTMLKHHLAQPDYRHLLAFCGSVFTNAVHWKGRGQEKEDLDTGVVWGGEQWRTWDSPDAIPREFGGYGGCKDADEAFKLYNARDVARNHELAPAIDNLLDRYEQRWVYENVSLPVAHVVQWMAEPGWKIDPTRVRAFREKLQREISELESELPKGLAPYEEPCMKNKRAPAGTYKEKTKTCKGLKRLGTAHTPFKLVFKQPGNEQCPFCKRVFESGPMHEAKIVKVPSTKRIVPWNSTAQVQAYAEALKLPEVLHQKTKRPTADKKARGVWARKHPEFTVVDGLKKRKTLISTFTKEALQWETRMYFDFLVHGTSEGRLSSSGRRKGIDLQVQNVPKAARVLFLPDHEGWGILNVDWKSGENWLTAHLARDQVRLTRLAQPGYDEHSDLASLFFGKEVSKTVNPELRGPGKIFNHKKNYGGGNKSILQDLHDQGFLSMQFRDVKELDRLWREELNPGTYRWQQDTAQLAREQSYLQNPFGRRRRFYSRDYRTKALAFLPASTLADMMLRCLIALAPPEWIPRHDEVIEALGLACVEKLPLKWRMVCTVHDSIVATGPHESHREAAGVLARVMSQPWKELGGFNLDVDVEYSRESWGDVKTLELLQEAA